MNSCRCSEIIKWFTEKYGEWIRDNRLISWAGKLGIKLNRDGILDNGQLFHLFVLAVLWNNKPTFKAEKGEQVFLKIKQKYTLKNFAEVAKNDVLANTLRSIAYDTIRNPHVFNLLMFIANGEVNGEKVWTKIKRILNSPGFGNRGSDVNRLKELYGIFNPRKYEEKAYFTVKTFLVFREIKIQFRSTGRYQYHSIICCIPDSNVRKALKKLNLWYRTGNDINSLISASEIVAENFCTDIYELYDLPLFVWYREKIKKHPFCKKEGKTQYVKCGHAGICPLCGAPLVWRRAQLTGELYRGCTNFKGGCRWNDRSY